MEDIPLLKDIVVIFTLSIAVLLICHKLRIPSIVGFLVTGVLCGPDSLALVSDDKDVVTLANVGIVLLLFTVGMEFSIKRLLEYKRYLIIGGALQLLLTSSIATVIAYLWGRPFFETVFLGWLISLSSTAIVLRVMEERGEVNSPHGKVALSILVFQDIAVIPMVLLTPLLAGEQTVIDMTFYYAVGKGLLLLVAVFIGAELVVPLLLHMIARTKSRELFVLGVLTICTTVAWVTSSIGVSLSLGAFLAGLIVSESEYSQEAIGNIIPFQDIFTSFFFVSVGMLLDIDFFALHWPWILSLTGLILLLKSSVVTLVTLILGMPMRTAVLTGLALCQVGEFSFVLIHAGMDHGLGSLQDQQLFLAVSLMTMGVTPWLISWSPSLASHISSMPMPPVLKFGLKPIVKKEEDVVEGHIIIIGMGLAGRSLAHAAREATIPYLILDMDAESVRVERSRGEPIHFGDATHSYVLNHANIRGARVVAIAVNDPDAAIRIVKLARHIRPDVYIIVRTRSLEGVKTMYGAGADDVVPDEFGSAIEIFSRVLKKYEVSHEQILHHVAELRGESYELHRFLYREPELFSDVKTNQTTAFTETFKVGNRSFLVGKSLGDLNLQNEHGITVIMIYRGKEMITNVKASEIIKPYDVVVFLGKQEDIDRAIGLFRKPRT